MFRKLIKYEMRAILRYWWLIAVILPIVSAVGALALRFTLSSTQFYKPIHVPPWLVTLSTLLAVLCIFCIFASMLVVQIFIYLRFYKNFFTDEGYLTFTLPVSRSKLLAAKALNGIFWIVIHTLLMGVCALFTFGLISPPPTSINGGIINPVVFDNIKIILADAWDALGAWLILYIVEIVTAMVLTLVFNHALIYFCITFGAMIAKKAKLLAAIAVYYVVNMVLSFVFQFFGAISIVSLANGFSQLMSNGSELIVKASLALIILIVIAVCAALACIAYFTTQSLIERKLNLP